MRKRGKRTRRRKVKFRREKKKRIEKSFEGIQPIINYAYFVRICTWWFTIIWIVIRLRACVSYRDFILCIRCIGTYACYTIYVLHICDRDLVYLRSYAICWLIDAIAFIWGYSVIITVTVAIAVLRISSACVHTRQ